MLKVILAILIPIALFFACRAEYNHGQDIQVLKTYYNKHLQQATAPDSVEFIDMDFVRKTASLYETTIIIKYAGSLDEIKTMTDLSDESRIKHTLINPSTCKSCQALQL